MAVDFLCREVSLLTRHHLIVIDANMTPLQFRSMELAANGQVDLPFTGMLTSRDTQPRQID